MSHPPPRMWPSDLVPRRFGGSALLWLGALGAVWLSAVAAIWWLGALVVGTGFVCCLPPRQEASARPSSRQKITAAAVTWPRCLAACGPTRHQALPSESFGAPPVARARARSEMRKASPTRPGSRPHRGIGRGVGFRAQQGPIPRALSLALPSVPRFGDLAGPSARPLCRPGAPPSRRRGAAVGGQTAGGPAARCASSSCRSEYNTHRTAQRLLPLRRERNAHQRHTSPMALCGRCSRVGPGVWGARRGAAQGPPSGVLRSNPRNSVRIPETPFESPKRPSFRGDTETGPVRSDAAAVPAQPARAVLRASRGCRRCGVGWGLPALDHEACTDVWGVRRQAGRKIVPLPNPGC